MDKKNTIIGLALLFAAFALIYFEGKNRPEPQPPPAQSTPADPATQPEQFAPEPTGPRSVSQPAATGSGGPATLEEGAHGEDETIIARSNGLIEAHFTNYGGAIQEIVLKDFRKTLDGDEPYIMNARRYTPALELSGFPQADKTKAYEILDTGDPSEVAFRTVVNEQLEIVRRYRLSQESEGAAPYSIAHTLEFRNLTSGALATGDFNLNVGTVAPSGKQDRFFLTFSRYDGEDTKFTELSDFTGGGFLFFKSDPKPFVTAEQRVDWVSVKNQFFITILAPEEAGVGYFAQPVQFPMQAGEKTPPLGMTGNLEMASLMLSANEAKSLQFNYYIGPKEHKRISQLPNSEEDAMQFGFTGFISKTLLLVMNWLYGIVGNYGVAIIMLTLLVRTILLPINIASTRSMKRMSKLQEPMKFLKEKYPDNQQKQQQMMMELYKLNKLNPVAGCLPMVLQIPIFFGLFYMLRSAAELRFAGFLWIDDLSKQEAVWTIPNFPIFGDLPINFLPIVMTVSMAYQMRMMPTPSVDNAQVKMMRFMPFIFFPITYTFASGLVLYWSASNLFTIGQQWLINRQEDQFDITLPPSLKKAMDEPARKGKKRAKR